MRSGKRGETGNVYERRYGSGVVTNVIHANDTSGKNPVKR